MKKQYPTEYGIFEWDTGKAQRNNHKHGISFERATEAFADAHAHMEYDALHSTYEDRFTLLGMVDDTLLVLVVFTGQTIIRIISARRASKKERKLYARR